VFGWSSVLFPQAMVEERAALCYNSASCSRERQDRGTFGQYGQFVRNELAWYRQMIGVCGLFCAECDIYKAVSDQVLAQRVADWFKTERGVDVAVAERGTGLQIAGS
jgi:hypothetical protein